MERITLRHLEHQLRILNGHFGIYEPDWDTVGHFTVSFAYGGCQIERIINSEGGVRDISLRGSKREVYEQLRSINKVLQEFADYISEKDPYLDYLADHIDDPIAHLETDEEYGRRVAQIREGEGLIHTVLRRGS